jgi:hypothetical protein
MSKRILRLSEVQEFFKDYQILNERYIEAAITELVMLTEKVETLNARVTSLESMLRDWKRGGHP